MHAWNELRVLDSFLRAVACSLTQIGGATATGFDPRRLHRDVEAWRATRDGVLIFRHGSLSEEVNSRAPPQVFPRRGET